MSWPARGFPFELINPTTLLVATSTAAELSRSSPGWSHQRPSIVQQEKQWASPIEALNWIGQQSDHPQRWHGFLSYGLGQHFEPTADAKHDPSIPLFAFGYSSARMSEAGRNQPMQSPRSNFARANYLNTVQRAVKYIAAGDVFQINLAQQFTANSARSPLEVYRELRSRFAAPFDALIQLGDLAIVSNSPELFLRVERLFDGSRRIINRPIKGTRPNRRGMHDELLNSEKDRAELAMIVDLQRNDLGRICKAGSVRVIEPRTIEAHPTVLHGVSTIEGILRDEITFTDILRALFPCGSVTGCPKIRAMQIISELEPDRRGVYCGAIGWIDPHTREMEFSVAIRTMTFHGSEVRIPVGGGIVADSVPEDEFDETITKARAMFASLGFENET